MHEPMSTSRRRRDGLLRAWRALGVATVACLVVAACGGGDRSTTASTTGASSKALGYDPTVLRRGNGPEPDTLDPQLARTDGVRSLSYLDLNRMTLGLHALFLVTNLTGTLLSLHLGFAYYGYGYFLASVLSFLAACWITFRCLDQLPYHAFITGNRSIQ